MAWWMKQRSVIIWSPRRSTVRQLPRREDYISVAFARNTTRRWRLTKNITKSHIVVISIYTILHNRDLGLVNFIHLHTTMFHLLFTIYVCFAAARYSEQTKKKRRKSIHSVLFRDPRRRGLARRVDHRDGRPHSRSWSDDCPHPWHSSWSVRFRP